MNRVFLDANILFSAAWRENTGLLRLWQSSDTTLLTSRYAYEEARRNLETEEQRQRLATLMVEIQRVPDRAYGDFPPGVFLPEKDRPILLAAIEAQATHLLTGDNRHFGPLYGHVSAACISCVPPTICIHLDHWKYPSKLEYIENGLKKFVETSSDKGISSIAFPEQRLCSPHRR